MRLQGKRLFLEKQYQNNSNGAVCIGITAINLTVKQLKNGAPSVQVTGAVPTKRNWLQTIIFKWRMIMKRSSAKL